MRWRFALCLPNISTYVLFWLIEIAPNRLISVGLLADNRTLFCEPSYLTDFTSLCSILAEKPAEFGKQAFLGLWLGKNGLR